MSFDLHFYPRPGKPPLMPEQFRTYFQRRRFFTLTDGWVAAYEHEDTGVSFSYALNAPPAGRRQICASFHMNYLRSRAFALEAERLVGWFVEDFGLLVRDPQAW